MPIPFRVHIHVGSHKTASTYIQHWLAKNKALIKENDVAYIATNVLRKRFMNCYQQLTVGNGFEQSELTTEMRDIIEAEILSCGFVNTPPKLLVLSEENLIGGCFSLSNKGQLYPRLKDKMKRLAHVFEGCETSIFMAIRNYCELYPAAYSETLRNGRHTLSFDEFMNKQDIAGNSWLEVVDDIASCFGSVNIWPYEQFKGNEQEILSNLLQISVTKEMIGAQTIHRSSLSRKGVEVIMNSKGILSALELKRLIDFMAEKMVFDPPIERLTIQNSVIAEQLDSKYRLELEKLERYLIIKL